MTESSIKFWDKVEKCKHKNFSSDYSEDVYCGTPWCDGVESHCLDCGVFITECDCHCEDGMSGWSIRRRMNFHRKLLRKNWLRVKARRSKNDRK